VSSPRIKSSPWSSGWGWTLVGLVIFLVVSSSHALYRDGALWPQSRDGITRIPVCFQTSGDYTAAEEMRLRELVRDALAATWARWMNIEFLGFSTCGSPVPNATLAIKLTEFAPDGTQQFGGAGDIPDQTIHLSGHRGFQGSRTPLFGWMQLNGISDRRAWGVVTHEVGHALAFEHEQSRPDAVNFCPVGNVILDGTIVTSEYDDTSTMNYCVPLDSGRLSMLDIRGGQSLYGTSAAGQWLKALPALSHVPIL
jgi:hypothetical protein